MSEDVDHRRLGTDLFNGVWTLLETEGRTAEQDDLMIHTAHASCYHWRQVGTPANFARGEWLCARVYATLGRAEPALHHAQRSLELCTVNGLEDWDLAFAHEALARAHAIAGDADAMAVHLELARTVPVAEADDRELLVNDLATIRPT